MSENGKKDYLALFRDLREKRIEKLYLFEGEEEYTKDRALERLRETAVGRDYPEMNYTVLKDPAPDALIAAVETVPFMADHRLVVVKECALLQGKPQSYDENAALSMLETYFPRIQDGGTLVFFVRGKADGKRRLRKILQKDAVCVDFIRPDETYLLKWTAAELKKRGKKILRETARFFWFNCGRDMYLLLSEIEKLAAYTEDREEITEEDILAVCVRSREARVFELADALLSGQGRKAFDIKKELCRTGTDPVFLLSLLGEQCRRVYYAAEMRLEGASSQVIAARLSVQEFAARAAMRLSGGFDRTDLRKICADCTDTEFAVKSGRIGDDGALEALMIRILALRKGRRDTG